MTDTDKEVDLAFEIISNNIERPADFSVGVALSVASETLNEEVERGEIDGFTIKWDGGKQLLVEKTVKLSYPLKLTVSSSTNIL